jgi:hypothetical protein
MTWDHSSAAQARRARGRTKMRPEHRLVPQTFCVSREQLDWLERQEVNPSEWVRNAIMAAGGPAYRSAAQRKSAAYIARTIAAERKASPPEGDEPCL